MRCSVTHSSHGLLLRRLSYSHSLAVWSRRSQSPNPTPHARAWTEEPRDLDGWVGGERNGGCMVLSPDGHVVVTRCLHGGYVMIPWWLHDGCMVVKRWLWWLHDDCMGVAGWLRGGCMVVAGCMMLLWWFTAPQCYNITTPQHNHTAPPSHHIITTLQQHHHTITPSHHS